MIVRNEEARLPAALESVKLIGAVNETVLVDTGSTDRTVEIARDYGARVYVQPWQDDFAFHRNYSLSKCSNDWVFIIDGDEELVDAGNLNELFEKPPLDAIAVQVSCVNGAGEPVESLVGMRAFDRRKARWKYPVHNQIVGIDECVVSSAELRAFYDDDVFDSAQRRLAILLDHADRNPDDPHYAFFICKSYRLLGNADKVVEWGDRYFNHRLDIPQGASVCAWMVQAKLTLGNLKEARELLTAGLTHYPNFADLLHLQLTLLTLQWARAASQPDPRYTGVSLYSAAHLARLSEAIEALGLPIESGV